METLAKSLMLVHVGIASVTGFDKFALQEKEADSLASNIANVMDQFDMSPDPRFMAVAGLITTSAMIYGPRIYLYREHLADKAKKTKQENVQPDSSAQFKPGDMSGFNLGG